jgi:hypothetical protein
MQIVFVNPQGDSMIIIGEQSSQSSTPASGADDSNIKGGIFHAGSFFSENYGFIF